MFIYRYNTQVNAEFFFPEFYVSCCHCVSCMHFQTSTKGILLGQKAIYLNSCIYFAARQMELLFLPILLHMINVRFEPFEYAGTHKKSPLKSSQKNSKKCHSTIRMVYNLEPR